MDNWLSQPSAAAYAFTFVFGLVIGSFLNVVIYRLPQETMSIVKPRSFCPICRAWIAWYDNLPVLSYFVLGGKCRHCKTGISFRYPLIEILTGFAFVATLILSPAEEPAVFFVRLGIVSALIAVTMIDFDHFIIPDAITLPGMGVALIVAYAFPSMFRHSLLFTEGNVLDSGSALIVSLMGIFIGAGSVYMVGLGGRLLFRKDAMGLGDVKFMGAMGGFLGPDAVLAAFILGALLGAIYGLGNVMILGFTKAIRLRKRGLSLGKAVGCGLRLGRRRGSYIPFGPFLSAGSLIVLFYRQEVFTFALETWPQWFRGVLGFSF